MPVSTLDVNLHANARFYGVFEASRNYSAEYAHCLSFSASTSAASAEV